MWVGERNEGTIFMSVLKEEVRNDAIGEKERMSDHRRRKEE